MGMSLYLGRDLPISALVRSITAHLSEVEIEIANSSDELITAEIEQAIPKC